MATLDDKLLGEKTQNYCSSSEDEHEDDDADKPSSSKDTKSMGPSTQNANSSSKNSNDGRRWEGYSCNTGPKGVLKDWQIFQEQQEQIRLDKERAFLEIIKEKSMTCAPESANNQIDASNEDDLMSDSIVEEFLRKRMDEMMKNHTAKVEVGKVHEINSGDEFLKFVDETNAKIPVVVHIYEAGTPECVKMNDCIASLSTVYLNTKFCRIRATVAGVSQQFRREGVPALLVYKGGDLIGNFARLKDELGHDFYEGDVENFLIENGMLEDRNNIPRLFQQK